MINVTTTGYTKLSIPSSVNQLLQSFWRKNRQFAWTEFWQSGNTIQNHWEQNCSVLDIGRQDVPHQLRIDQRHHIVQTVQHELEEWTQRPLVLTASVGIRAYLQNTIIAPHVDRLPFVITAVLHIAQHNVNDDDDNNNNNNNSNDGWPIQLVVTDTKTGTSILKNITTVPGEMIVYEGTSIVHGRPYPLPPGNKTLTEADDPTYMAVLYLHFEPVGYTVQHTLRRQQQQMQQQQKVQQQVQQQSTKQPKDEDGTTTTTTTIVDDPLYYELPTTTYAMDKASRVAFERSLAVQQEKMQQQQQEQSKEQQKKDDSNNIINNQNNINTRASSTTTTSASVPRYVWDTYRDAYRQKFFFQHEPAIYPKPSKVVFGQITAHQAAALGDMSALRSLATKDRTVLFKADINGWRPLHEAARSGHADVIEYLLEEGAQVNARTNNGSGGTALYWAEKEPKKNSKAIAVLKKYGAVNIPPEYNDKE
ncbi:pfs, nacht and ankyrin domain containing protein [Nitzschia inconspicua]|uniref:Pfs, nacht and ankyrin domain containing protein n=1 Tax=Nitzschia inconspicua TaxID=303405 RepID=A0A9K3KWU4_9STRA|nr:pfs, nacht and ankyrin domain containing protein [Nitzschia inconspicua]